MCGIITDKHLIVNKDILEEALFFI